MTSSMGTSPLRTAKFWLRAIELIFSIITFSVVAEYNGSSSKVNFTLFTGITAMVLCLVFIVIYLMDMADKPSVVLVELIINVLWWIFWLATAACLTDIVNQINGGGWIGYDASRFKTSTAFAWITFALWTVSSIISIRDLMQERKASSIPTIPNSSQPDVAMV